MAKLRAYQFLEAPKVSGERGVTGWTEVDEPVCPEYGAILRPVAVAACTSDVHMIRQANKKTPIQLGHETVGEVLEVGKSVRDFKPGDRVVISNAQPYWGTPESYDYPPKLAKPDPSKVTIAARTWVEKFAVENADMNLEHVPDSVSSLKAVMIPDMMGTAFEAVEKAHLRFGDSVAIIGIGPVGLMAVAASSIRGAGRIIAVGSRRACVEVAYKYGVNEVIDYKKTDDIFASIIEANGGERVDAVIITGGEDGGLIGNSLRCVKNGGHIVNAAGFMDRRDFVLPANEFMMGTCETTITGVVVGGGRHFERRMLSLIENGRIDPSLAVSHVLHGFDAIPEGLAIMENKSEDMIKSVVLMDE